MAIFNFYFKNDFFQTIGDVRGVGMFVGFELVKDRNLRTPNRDAADFVLKRFRSEKVLMQADGPDVNVIKLKPPLAFNKVTIQLKLTKR